MIYPLTPGFSNDTTSREAAELAADTAPQLRQRVWELIDQLGGAISETVETKLGYKSQSITPRIRELVLEGRLYDSGRTGETSQKRRAIIWVTRTDQIKPKVEPIKRVYSHTWTNNYFIGNTDLSQVECRVLNTLAGEWDVVEKFRNRVDIYSELASRFYGYPVDKSKPSERGTGKQLELSCGYGAGGPTIVRTARAGTYGPPVTLTDQQGLAARDLYRGTHPFVTALWEKAEQILWMLLDGSSMEWGPPGQTEPCMQIHDHRIFHMDSMLWLDYSSLERVRTDAGEEIWRHKVRSGWRKTYGARLIENVVQWLAMLIISDALVRVRYQLGYKVPLTVHDNIYTLIPLNAPNGEDPKQQLIRICDEVAKPVPWLERCPIAAEAELLTGLAGEPLFKYVAG